MERSEKIRLLKLLQAGKISREEFAEKAYDPPAAPLVIYRGNQETGPFFIDEKEYPTREALDEFLEANRINVIILLPEKDSIEPHNL